MQSLLVQLIVLFGVAASALVALVNFRHAGVAVAFVIIVTHLSIFIVVIAISLNYPRLSRHAMVDDFAEELEARGLLVAADFRADRAFRVDEFSLEGPHYLLELEGGGILHLSGRYLYDYEPIGGAPRRFPCTQFKVRRHAELGYVVDLICGGIIIEPEVEAPPYSAQDFEYHNVPADGEILESLTFEQLRQQRSAASWRFLPS